MILVYLAVNPYLPRLYPGKLRLHWKVLTDIVRVGVPAGIQAMVITLSNMFAQYHINSFGVDAIAAFTAYFKVELILYLPITAFGQAVTTFVGQNIGAGDVARARRGTRTCIGLGIGVTMVLGALTLLFRRQAFGLFATDPAVIEIGAGIACVTFPFYSIYVIMEVLADTIRGAGKSFVPMALIMANICGLRILYLAAAMALFHRISVLAAAYPVTWAAAAICLTVYYKKMAWMPYSTK